MDVFDYRDIVQKNILLPKFRIKAINEGRTLNVISFAPNIVHEY